jgi:TetR/AcrR family transcriptional repressor of mexJK operon
MDEIAIAAGVSKTTIYSRFGDKGKLFLEVVADEPAGPPADALGHAAEVTDLAGLRDSLRATGLALVEMLASPDLHERFRLLISHSTRDKKMAALFYESAPEFMQKNVAGLLASATSRGDLNVPEPMVAADQLLSMWMGLHNLRQQLGLAGPRSKRGILRHVNDCLEMFLRAYNAG